MGDFMRIRLYNARLLTMTDGDCVFWGEIWIRDDRIEKVISFASFSKMEETLCEKDESSQNGDFFDQQIDCMGNLLMPGFKNCHAHGPMTFLRSFADDLPLQEWLQTKIFPAEALLTKEDVYVLMQLAVLEYVRGGITTSFEMYFQPQMIAKACIDMGYRVVLSGTVFGEQEPVDEVMNALRQDYLQFRHFDALVDYKIGFHSEYSCCETLLREIAHLCQEYHEPVFMHNSETQREVLACQKKYGKTPIQLMDDLGLFAYGGAGHHVVYTEDSDINILRQRGVYVVTNPSSNLKLASGIAPIKKYVEHGIKVAIGTDGPASNNSLNFFKEMYLTACLQKVKYENAAALAPFEVLKMATLNGANMLGLDDCNCLQAGKQADIIMIDLLKPNMQPMNHLINNIVYSGSTENVIMTMIAGKILYVNGTYQMDVDPLDIYEKANCIIRRIECSL